MLRARFHLKGAHERLQAMLQMYGWNLLYRIYRPYLRPSPNGTACKDVADILSGATVGARTGLKVGLLELQSLEA